MSRIGKKPVPLPKGVVATIDEGIVSVKGPKGELKLRLVPEVSAALGEGNIAITPREESDRARAMWGMQRTLVNNLVRGVTEGFSEKLEIAGVGYRAAVQGKNLQLQLGFSHDVLYPSSSMMAKSRRLFRRARAKARKIAPLRRPTMLPQRPQSASSSPSALSRRASSRWSSTAADISTMGA